MTVSRKNRASLAVAAASLSFGVVGTIVVVPPAVSQARSTIRFDIPAGPLTVALGRFAEVTGIQIVYGSDLTQDIRSPGLKGELTPQEALTQLLAGTGLSARMLSPTSATIEKASGKGSRVLGPVRVEGADRSAVNGINGSRDVTATEGTGSFTSGALTIGSKSPRAIKDTPQSVSVITAERLQQQNIDDFTSALTQAPGVTLVQGGPSSTGSSLESAFYSRGFPITSIQIDGGAPLTTKFAGGFGSAYFPLIDLSQFDHVEVLRGAAGLFTGYGDPSGTINLVRKKPLDHARVALDAEWGSWNRYRTTLDASQPLGFDGRLRGRMVLTWQSNEYFYEVAEDQKTLIYGVVDYDLTPTTVITAGVSESSQDSTPWHAGLPRYQTGGDLHLPRETSFAFPWNRWDFDTTEVFGSIEQRIGEEWTAKLNLTRNQQESTRKFGYSQNAVNPIDNRGPRLFGSYLDYASDQLSAEATLSGAFTLFGQRQEVTLGVNRSDQDGGGRIDYAALITSSATQPYQPYPGGPRYCTSATACGDTRIASPPINVFDFDPLDPLYTEPANPLPSQRHFTLGQVQTLAYANLRLTAFDRLHLETGVRWSQYENKADREQICTSTTAPAACVGRQIGDGYSPSSVTYTGDDVSWPPAIALSYDVTDRLTAYLGYTDIYQDQSYLLDGDLEPLGPITGENYELGIKWAGRDGRLNATLSVYRIEKQGFQQQETNIARRFKRNPDGSYFMDPSDRMILVTNDGTELPDGKTDPNHTCCYIQRQDQTERSEGVDAELTGEVLPGWQVAASYTFSRNEQKGGFYGNDAGTPFLSIQPEHLYKLWTSYDFRAAGRVGWLGNLVLSAGVNGQSAGYRSGRTCPADQVGQPDPFTGEGRCLVPTVPYEFTVEPYAVVSGRIDYRFHNRWSAALHLENLFDKTYYQSVGSVTAGNWYGTPRSYTLSVRATF